MVSARANSKLAIRLLFTFLEIYKDDIDKSIRQMEDAQLERVGQDLRIEYSKMADFFQPVVEGMFQCMSQTSRGMWRQTLTPFMLLKGLEDPSISKVIADKFGDSYKYITPTEPA